MPDEPPADHAARLAALEAGLDRLNLICANLYNAISEHAAYQHASIKLTASMLARREYPADIEADAKLHADKLDAAMTAAKGLIWGAVDAEA